MQKTPQIGWQKYEDVLESQMSSPLMDKIYSSMSKMIVDQIGDDIEEEALVEDQEVVSEEPVLMNISDELSSQINLANNFECWVAHTNFNLTENIKDELDRVEGIELLRVFSRYRFLIGIGKMFEFTDVRKSIEETLGTIGE